MYVCVHTDYLGTLDNHNARSKFILHSSTLMKNPIRCACVCVCVCGGGGGRVLTSQEVMYSETHCVLGFIFSLTGIFRASFSKDAK